MALHSAGSYSSAECSSIHDVFTSCSHDNGEDPTWSPMTMEYFGVLIVFLRNCISHIILYYVVKHIILHIIEL